MITSVRLVNFKNFADETLRVGPFTVIVGANASGKSNIRDAFRFLHGIGRGYTLAEIMGGKYGPGSNREWDGIRGAMNEVMRFERPSFSMEVEVSQDDDSLHYAIEVDYDRLGDRSFQVKNEEFWVGQSPFYTCYWDGESFVLDVGDLENRVYPLSSSAPFLSDVFETDWPPGESTLVYDPSFNLKMAFAGMRFLDFVPAQMQMPAFPGATVLGDSGENLSTVLEAICKDPERQHTLISWVHELTPMDIEDLEFRRDLSGRVHLLVVERGGHTVSAYSASDGTLRFLGMLAVLLSPDPAGIYFFEEIDNGIHPNRLWLLVDLIERQTAKNGIQVIATTHSPDMLNFINDTTFENTSITYRDEKSADAIIRPVAELPNARELRNSQGLGRLHTSGWMETALAFTEGGYDEDSEAEN